MSKTQLTRKNIELSQRLDQAAAYRRQAEQNQKEEQNMSVTLTDDPLAPVESLKDWIGQTAGEIAGKAFDKGVRAEADRIKAILVDRIDTAMAALANLDPDLDMEIYGQDEAIRDTLQDLFHDCFPDDDPGDEAE